MCKNSLPRLPTEPALSNDDKSEGFEALRQRYDARLACLKAPGANEKLRTLMDQPIDLSGVKIGQLPPPKSGLPPCPVKVDRSQV